MAEETFLTDDLLRQLMSVGEVDLLVAIPSHDNVKTIGTTVAKIEESFQRNFPRARTVVVNMDAGSRDGTRDAVLRAEAPRPSYAHGLTTLRTEHRIATKYAAAPSPSLAYRTIFASAELLRAKACAIVSPAVADLAATWVPSLLQPVYQAEVDFVAPLYSRRKYDGLLARNLLYPMSRAIFGRGIRELHSSEAGLSLRLVSHCLNQDVWHERPIQQSPEIWLAISALCSEFSCCQTFLGPKEYSAHGREAGTVETVRQIVSAFFWCLETYQSWWLEKHAPSPVPTFGPDHELLAVQPAHISQKNMLGLFKSGVSQLSEILQSILTEETHAHIQRLASLEGRSFHFCNELWAKTLCEFAASYHHAALDRNHLIQALVPIYRGRIYSFLLQHRNSSQEEMESDLENLCQAFEKQKPHLMELWTKKA